MLSKIPVDLHRLSDKDIDREILRAAKEEKTHVGEFQTLLLKFNPQQRKELEEGVKEVEGELSGRK